MDGPGFTHGWIDSRVGINQAQIDRAEYTIKRLKLNQRENLTRGRARITLDFLGWMKSLIELGPDYEVPSGYTIRQRLLDLLDATEPYLAPVRQILYAEPDYSHLYQVLLEHIPELEAALGKWALPPGECMNSEEA